MPKEDIALRGVEREAGNGQAGPTTAGGGIETSTGFFCGLAEHSGYLGKKVSQEMEYTSRM